MLLLDLKLISCDSLDISDVGYTYRNISLEHKSYINHYFVSSNVIPFVKSLEVIKVGCNLFDHCSVRCVMQITSDLQWPVNAEHNDVHCYSKRDVL